MQEFEFSRRAALIGGATLLLGTLAACGSDKSSGSSSSSSSAGFAPLTIDHQFGSTVIKSVPKTVVTMLGNWTDACIALNVPITAEYKSTYYGPSSALPWVPAHQSKVITFTTTDKVNVEQLAALQPDVILAGFLPSRALYDQLSKIAPTIPVLDKTAVMDTWQDVTLTAGKIFGKVDQAKSLTDGLNTKIADFGTKYPGLKGKTFSFGQLYPDGQIGLVGSATDPSARLLGQLGMKLDPRSTAAAKGGQRVLVSSERVNVLASDLLLMWPLVAKPDAVTKIPGWNNLPAVQNGAVLFLDNTTALSFGAPTIYSVPYALNLLTPTASKVR